MGMIHQPCCLPDVICQHPRPLHCHLAPRGHIKHDIVFACTGLASVAVSYKIPDTVILRLGRKVHFKQELPLQLYHQQQEEGCPQKGPTSSTQGGSKSPRARWGTRGPWTTTQR